ncbi:MAG: hypothetical protein ACI82A_002531 [Candidatus Azotimanducaceae bacterium]|jgi:hypothetical protein
MNELQTYIDELEAIDLAIANGTYKKGRWQRIVRELQGLPPVSRKTLSMLVTRVSDHLHKENEFPSLPVAVGFAAEVVLFIAACLLLLEPSIWLRLLGVAALALCLQPSIKILTASILGVRYSYVFLWYVEPRFKMQFGSYLARSPGQKMLINAMGSIGTPIALAIGFVALRDVPWLSLLCLAGLVGATVMQIGAFIAALMGVRKVGPFLLTTLTTPATLGAQVREMLGK